jgi:predicted nucleic acid-binding protein
MRAGIDTNVLLAAHLPCIDHHEKVRATLERLLSDPDTTLCIPPLVIDELLHVATNTRRFENALSMPVALELVRSYLDAANVEITPEDERSTSLAVELMRTHDLGRKRIGDTMIAASLIAAGVTDLVTTNVRDYRAFTQLTLHDPRTW